MKSCKMAIERDQKASPEPAAERFPARSKGLGSEGKRNLLWIVAINGNMENTYEVKAHTEQVCGSSPYCPLWGTESAIVQEAH